MFRAANCFPCAKMLKIENILFMYKYDPVWAISKSSATFCPPLPPLLSLRLHTGSGCSAVNRDFSIAWLIRILLMPLF